VEDCFFNFPGFLMYVPIKFPMCSQYVPQVPNGFPNMFFIAPHFYPICLDKCFVGGQKGRNSNLQNRTF
jgi:hypothetical protein